MILLVIKGHYNKSQGTCRKMMFVIGIIESQRILYLGTCHFISEQEHSETTDLC